MLFCTFKKQHTKYNAFRNSWAESSCRHISFYIQINLCDLNVSPLLTSISDYDSLNEEDHAANLQLAFDISEKEFGFRPFTSVKELSVGEELDKSQMTSYLSKFYELFRGTPLPPSGTSYWSAELLWTMLML